MRPVDLYSCRDVVFSEAGELFDSNGVLEASFHSRRAFAVRDRPRFERRHQRAWDKPVVMPGRFLWVTDRLSYFYFHWLCDVLPRVEALCGAGLGAPPPLLLPRRMALQGFVKESLGAWPDISIAPQLEPGQSGKPEEILLVTRPAEVPSVHGGLIRAAAKRLTETYPVDGPVNRRIYVTRRHARTRRVVNEAELENVLAGNGFEIFEMERLAFRDQIALMRQTAILAGPHGGGLTNMMFMPAGGRVLELRKKAGPPHCFRNLAIALGHEWRSLPCNAVDEEEHPHAAHIMSDPSAIERILKDLG